MRSLIVAVLALFAVGCGQDPRTGRLSPGQSVIVAGPVERGQTTGVPIHSDRARGIIPGTGLVGFGQKARVIRDESDRDDPPGTRWVFVRVLEGQQDGVDGEVHRSDLLASSER